MTIKQNKMEDKFLKGNVVEVIKTYPNPSEILIHIDFDHTTVDEHGGDYVAKFCNVLKRLYHYGIRHVSINTRRSPHQLLGQVEGFATEVCRRFEEEGGKVKCKTKQQKQGGGGATVSSSFQYKSEDDVLILKVFGLENRQFDDDDNIGKYKLENLVKDITHQDGKIKIGIMLDDTLDVINGMYGHPELIPGGIKIGLVWMNKTRPLALYDRLFNSTHFPLRGQAQQGQGQQRQDRKQGHGQSQQLMFYSPPQQRRYRPPSPQGVIGGYQYIMGGGGRGGGGGGNVHRPKKAKVNESRLLKQQSLPKSGGKNLLFGDDDDDDDDDFPDL
jgi:hypothetical protein